MKERVSRLRRLADFFGSNKGFWLIVLLFVAQAVWIALSNRYPMAFDEDYHLGIIRLYAHHMNPFWQTQPANASMYGAVYRDPSYLYHFLMSFPYRCVSLFTASQTVQVLWLRFANILLFASGLLIYRRLLRQLGLSALATNFSLLIFTFVPVASLLAAQINYDNLFIPLVALATLWTVELTQETVAYKRINAGRLLRLLILCLLASLVKYAFLPFFVAIGIFLLIVFAKVFKSFRKLLLTLGFGLTLMTRTKRMVLLLLLVVSAALFLQRYGVNLIRYHTPLPDCSRVLSVRECSDYGPWDRDYLLASQKTSGHNSPFAYLGQWSYGMWLRLFFTVDGPPTQYQTRGPLFLPAIGAIVFAILSLLLFIRHAPYLWNKYRLILGAPALMAFLYVLSLWLDGYAAYARTGQPVAINGRYLLPILPLLFALAVLVWRHALAGRHVLKGVVATLAVLCMIWGGGALTFILRSSNSWYWPNATMRTVNVDIRNAVGPAVPGYYNPTLYLR